MQVAATLAATRQLPARAEEASQALGQAKSRILRTILTEEVRISKAAVPHWLNLESVNTGSTSSRRTRTHCSVIQ